MGKSFASSNPCAQILAFVLLCLSSTSIWQKYKPLVFSSFLVLLIYLLLLDPQFQLYTSDSRAPCSCWVFVFMEGAISKLPSFTFHSLLYFPVALLDLEIIFSNFKSLLYFSWKWTVEFFFNICFPVCLFSWELLCDCHLMLLVSLEIHWGCLCLSDVYGLVVWCDY